MIKNGRVLNGAGLSGRIVHFAVLSPKRSRKTPHNTAQYEVEISFNNFGVDGWATIRQNGKEIDLGPEELSLLTSLLVERFPLDALSGVGKEPNGDRAAPPE